MDLIELFTLISIVLATMGLFANYYQIRKSNLLKRAEYIVKLYNQFVNDKQMIDFYYKIEYGMLEYKDDFHLSEEEKNLDKILGHFSNIGRLFFMRILKPEDLEFLEYEFIILYKSEFIQNYFGFLDRWTDANKLNEKKFDYFRKTAEFLINK